MKLTEDEIFKIRRETQGMTVPFARAVEAEVLRLNGITGDGMVESSAIDVDEQLGKILREAVNGLDAARKKTAELDGREPDTWQYATAIIGTAMHKTLLIAAAPKTVVQDGWMPIETAPKDGTKFLAFWPHKNEPRITYWAGRTRSAPGWRAYAMKSMPAVSMHGEPTRWMPLPAAPKVG